MPQKIHPWNTKNRPAVGRFSCLVELGSRPIQAEPVHIDVTGEEQQQDLSGVTIIGYENSSEEDFLTQLKNMGETGRPG